MKLNLVLSLAIGLLVPQFAAGKNVDLSTVPRRDSVQLTIYNSEDLTLVRETRLVTFKKGVNPLQFSWANTLIDPTSVELKFPGHSDQIEVVDTTFPSDKPQMLYWNVVSTFDGEAAIEISYFTSGITWAADYVCIADKDEQQLSVESFVRVTNRSGEEYENAQIRLVVGTINLVEKIAELAQIPVSDVGQLGKDRLESLQKSAEKRALSGINTYTGTTAITGGKLTLKEKEIIKEGLSEYFIYTVEGTETIPNGWSKRMRSFESKAVPFKIQYRYRPVEYGAQLVRMYLFANDKNSKLGLTPLPDGTIHLFRNNGHDGLSYLTTQHVKYIAIGDKIELNLGPDPSVIFELEKLRTYRDDIWLKVSGVNIFMRVSDAGVRIEPNATVAGWDDHDIYRQRIRNYTSKPIDIEIRRAFPGHVVFKSELTATLHDFQTVQITTSVEAGKKVDLIFELLRHQGHNSRQSNMTLEPAVVKP